MTCFQFFAHSFQSNVSKKMRVESTIMCPNTELTALCEYTNFFVQVIEAFVPFGKRTTAFYLLVEHIFVYLVHEKIIHTLNINHKYTQFGLLPLLTRKN